MSYYSLKRLFNLHAGAEDSATTLENVKSNISFKGANLWILACAILIASVGLNINSTAVIIGAMLISPLMGPIVASGFALGIYDFTLLKRALRNLLTATVTSLLVSTTFFLLSPFKEVQSELLARTSPNIYDILIAFFGGITGVIAVTRVEKGNPIPGVAIATALMPPLCTAGYGLATGNLRFFFGAFFLYSINCVFICIATFLIIKYLKYPAVKQVDEKHQKQVKYGITAIILFMLLPSAYFAYSLYQKQKFEQSVSDFIEKEFVQNGFTIVYKKSDYNSSPKKIELAFLSNKLSTEEEKKIEGKLPFYGIRNTELNIRHNDDIEALKNDIMNEVNKSENTISEKDKIISQLQLQIASNTYDNAQILKETQTLFPDVSGVSLANHFFTYKEDSSKNILKDSISKTVVLLYQAKNDLDSIQQVTLKKWLRERLNINDLVLVKQMTHEETEKAEVEKQKH